SPACENTTKSRSISRTLSDRSRRECPGPGARTALRPTTSPPSARARVRASITAAQKPELRERDDARFPVLFERMRDRVERDAAPLEPIYAPPDRGELERHRARVDKGVTVVVIRHLILH